jgi:integration host factor subunit beta
MMKSKLVERVAAATQETVKDSQKAVDAVFSFIEQALENGDIVEIRRFGSFRMKQRELRQGRNPKTGKSLTIPAKAVRVFKPSKQLTERVNVPAFPSHAKFGLDSLK